MGNLTDEKETAARKNRMDKADNGQAGKINDVSAAEAPADAEGAGGGEMQPPLQDAVPAKAGNANAPAKAEIADTQAETKIADARAEAEIAGPPTEAEIMDARAEAGNADARAEAGNADAQAEKGNTNTPAKKEIAPVEGGDSTREDILNMAVETGAGKQDTTGDAKETADPFDTLPVKWKEDGDTEADKDNVVHELQGLKKDIGKLREGNLYKAVVLARHLEQGKSNPMAAGRVSRFLDSSVWDNAADVNLIALNGISMINTLDTNPKSKGVWQVAILVSNLVAAVTTFRNLVQKIRKFAAKGTGTFDRLILAVGMIGDTATLLAKAISIINTIVSLAGKNSEVLKKIASYMWLLTGTTQITGIISGSTALYKGISGTRKLENQKKQLSDRAADVIAQKKERITQKEINLSGSPSSWKEDDRIEAAKALLQDKGAELTEEEKDALIMYLGMTRRVSRLIESQILTAAGLITSLIGLSSSATTGANNIVNGSEVENKTLKDAATGMSLVTNIAAMTNSTAKIAGRAANIKKGERADLVQNRLWEKIAILKNEEYGLKGLEESMIHVPEDQLEYVKVTAAKVKELYKNTEGQFAMMGVPYGQLLKANKLDDFKKILIASM